MGQEYVLYIINVVTVCVCSNMFYVLIFLFYRSLPEIKLSYLIKQVTASLKVFEFSVTNHRSDFI